MKNILLLIVLLFAALLPVHAFAHGPSKTEKTAPDNFVGLDTEAGRAVVAFHDALSNSNAKTVMAVLSPDVIILEGARIERSAQEYREHHLQADMRFSAAVNTTTVDHYVHVYGDTAVSISRSRTEGTYKGNQIDRQGNETLVLKLIDGHWTITHIHWSH